LWLPFKGGCALSTILQAIINGIMIGGIYAMVGMSLNLIFGVMKIVNFCQGEILMIGMYLSYLLCELGLDPFMTIPIVAVLMFGFGALLQVTLITKSIRSDDDSNVLFLTACLGILFSNLALLIFKSNYRTATSFVSNKVFHINGLNISVPKLLSFLFLMIVTILIFSMLKYSMLGKQIRATSQNPTGAKVCGVKTNKIYAITYGLGASIAGIAGACLMSFYYVYPTVGTIYGTRSFIVVTLGGLGSVIGAFVGGIVLGLLETVGAVAVGSSFKDTLVFIIFILILVGKERLKLKKKRG
jgi:branched-chain amino acid transport system permease protein